MTREEDQLLDQREAARYLGLRNQGTLANWRHKGVGPDFVKLNNHGIRYRLADLASYVDSQRVQPSCGRLDLSQIEEELKRIDQEIQGFGSFEATPEDLLRQYAALWEKWTAAKAQEGLHG